MHFGASGWNLSWILCEQARGGRAFLRPFLPQTQLERLSVCGLFAPKIKTILGRRLKRWIYMVILKIKQLISETMDGVRKIGLWNRELI